MSSRISYPPTEGSAAFDTLVRAAGFTSEEVGAALPEPVSAVTVYHWRIGAKVPRPVNRRAIEAWSRKHAPRRGLTAIEPAAWDRYVQQAA